MKGFVLAGTSSGSGKTVSTLVVLRALQSLGEDPQPAKIGPDYIDPSHHRSVVHKPSLTLDLWLEGEEGVIANYSRGEGSICVAEGVMGLYDGELSSTALVAESLGLPVVLVIDGSAGMESVAATALGFKDYADFAGVDLDLLGVIASKVNSRKHEEGIKNALPPGMEYFGRIPRLPGLEVPDRHLGLYMGEESPVEEEVLEEAGKYVFAKRLLDVAREPDLLEVNDGGGVSPTGKRVGVARDSAFNFIYPGTTRALQERARVETFSPLKGESVDGFNGIYLPGGYPELYAGKLAESPTLGSINEAARRGVPVFGECGGMMVMTKEMTTREGKRYDMAGILPARVEMVERLQGLGYVEMKALTDNPIAEEGDVIRGHEFHYSQTVPESDARYGFATQRGRGITGKYDGMIEDNALGTYTHFHGASGIFDFFVERL